LIVLKFLHQCLNSFFEGTQELLQIGVFFFYVKPFEVKANATESAGTSTVQLTTLQKNSVLRQSFIDLVPFVAKLLPKER
jgi:hypothetical protein